LIYKLLFDDKVTKDLKKIDKAWQKKILKKIKTTLIDNPKSGKKLIGNLSSYYRIRVGDYRVIYEVKDDEIIVLVVKIKQSKDIYK
jgi:mRNA interferase RelE/StbE